MTTSIHNKSSTLETSCASSRDRLVAFTEGDSMILMSFGLQAMKTENINMIQSSVFLISSKNQFFLALQNQNGHPLLDLKIYYLRLYTIGIRCVYVNIYLYYYLYVSTYIHTYILKEIYAIWANK